MNGKRYFTLNPESSLAVVRAISPETIRPASVTATGKRLESIDLLRGIVMIIMALDHVRDYFHRDAFFYSPTDLSKTSVVLFFTRWITHFCAPVFVFLTGVSAHLYGLKRSRKELSFFLLTRGIWLILIEVFILSLIKTFNPSFPFLNLQVIWAIGISMIALSALIYMNGMLILATGFLLIACHNLLDKIHIPGNGLSSFLWSLLHEQGQFSYGHFNVSVFYPVLPWIGIMAMGYCFGSLYIPGYDAFKRRMAFSIIGIYAIAFFVFLRSGNWYGDAAHWSGQKNFIFSVLSFLNTTKYPPSFLYVLMTLGPALIFLAIAEKPLGKWAAKIRVIGRVPMFYYLSHYLLIHLLASFGAIISGYKFSDMVISDFVNKEPQLKGYGFNLLIVYLVWISVIFFLYPLCKKFDGFKRARQSEYWWLSYL